MLGLLQDFAHLDDGRVAVVAIDGGEALAADREGGMASAIAEQRVAFPDRLVVALVGNIHSQRGPRARARKDFTPLAEQLDAQVEALVTLDMRYSGGTAWTCMADGCGSHEIPGNTDRDAEFVELLQTPDGFGYSGTYGVGRLIASPAAVPREDWDHPHAAP